MAAPAVIIADTAAHPDVSTALRGIESKLKARRPDLPIHLVELGTVSTLDTVLDSLEAEGVEEAVFVPLDLRSATAYSPELDDAVTVAKDRGIMSIVSRPIGPATELLNILDELVRVALHRRSALEARRPRPRRPCRRRRRGSALLSRRARQWSAHHRLPVQLAVEEGDGSLRPPSRRCARRGDVTSPSAAPSSHPDPRTVRMPPPRSAPGRSRSRHPSAAART